MTEKEILDLHKTLKARRKIRTLWKELRLFRPTLSDSTVRRALQSNPVEVTDTLEWVREEAVKFIQRDDARIAGLNTIPNASAHSSSAQISQNISM
jgi:hypothetical protein